MYKTLVAILLIVWVLDILNMPFMSALDTTYPVNFWAWLLIWVLIPSTDTIINKINNEEEKEND